MKAKVTSRSAAQVLGNQFGSVAPGSSLNTSLSVFGSLLPKPLGVSELDLNSLLGGPLVECTATEPLLTV